MSPTISFSATVLFCAALTALAQSARPDLYKTKADLLYKISMFVEWPLSAATGGKDFAICILGKDPFGAALDDAIRGKGISGRKIVAKRIDEIAEVRGCSILYIAESEEHPMPEVAWALENKSVLTVGEGNQFTSSGGMIGFITEGDRVRFNVNVAAAKRAGLTISSTLLNVANAVGGEAARHP